MTKTINLLESATLVSEAAASDGTWKVKLISEGKGSSGTYTASLLEQHHHAFDNVLSFKNHPGTWDGPQTRDFTMIAGEILGETWVEKDERGLTAVYGNYKPDEEYKDKLERYKGKLGLSVYIEGSGYYDENDEFIVDWFNPADPYASLDVVIAPGARGQFLESMRKTYDAQRSESEKSPGARQAEENKEIQVDELKELKAAVEALSSQVASLVTEKTNAEAAKAQVEADEAAVTSAIEAYSAAVKAVDEADLLPVQRDAILEAAKRGEDVAARISEAKAIKEAAVESVRVTEGSGRLFGASGDEDWTVAGVRV